MDTDEVRKLLNLADHRQRPCAEARVLAAAHLADVRAKIADLQAMERVLEETVARGANGRSARCPLIDAFYRDGLARAREMTHGRSGSETGRCSAPATCDSHS